MMENDLGPSPFDRIPTEVKRIIFSFLAASDLLQCALVSKEWNKVIDDDVLWIHHCTILLKSLENEKDTLWNRLVGRFLKIYLFESEVSHLTPYDCFWALTIVTNKAIPPVWQDCCDWYMFNTVPEDAGMVQTCYSGSVNSIVSHLFSICSLPWCQVMSMQYQSRKCLCGIATERDIFTWTVALTMKLGQCIFLKKVQEVLNIPSLQWMHAVKNRRKKNTEWLMESLQKMVAATEQMDVPVQHDVTMDQGCRLAGPDRALSGLQESNFVPSIVIPIQQRCLKVLTSFIRASSPEDLCTETLGGRVLIEAINNTLNTTKWFVKVEKVESVKKQLTQATIKKMSKLTHKLPTMGEFESHLLNVKVDPKKAASDIKLKSSEMLTFFDPIQVASYMAEESSFTVTHSVTRALQTYSQALTTPITSFCYESNENSAKVSVLEHAIKICHYLHKTKDYLSLKHLLSAIRASMSQGHSTHVSWKNISDKGCKRFKKFEDTMTAQKGYDKYLSTVQALGEPFIPYPPAHQLLVQRDTVSTIKPQIQDWIQLYITGQGNIQGLLAAECVDFLHLDIGTQLRAALETWNILFTHS